MELIYPRELNIQHEVAAACNTAALDYINRIFKLSPKQTFFTEEPVDIQTFVESKRHLGLYPLTPRQKMYFDFMIGEDPKTMFENMNQLAVLCFGKGCIAGDTELILSDGTRTTAKECNKNTTISALDDKGRIIPGKASEFYCKGKEPLFVVSTSTGKVVTVTAGHKFLTPKGWQELGSLQEGSWICAPAKILLPNNKNLDYDLCRITGYLIGDGHFGTKSISLIASQPEIISDFCSRVARLGGITTVSNSFYPDNKYKTSNIYLHSTSVIDFKSIFSDMKLWHTKSEEKRIPSAFFIADDTARKNLIEGLFASDGWITKKKKAGYQISYCSKSSLLTKDIQNILLSFGILSAITPKYTLYKGERRKYFILSLRNKEDIIKFFEIFQVPTKDNLRHEVIASKQKTQGSGRMCPAELLKFLGDSAHYPSQVRKHIKYLKARSLGARQETLYTWAKEFNIPELQQLTSPDVSWERIKKITPMGEGDFYTPTVDVYENYVAEGLFHHNSGKDFMASVFLLYCAHVLLCMEAPSTYFRLQPGDSIDCVNVAPSGDNASDVFFEKVKQLVKRWRWLSGRYAVKESNALINSVEVSGMDNLVSITKDGIIFPKRIRLHSRNSNKESAEGLNTLVWIMDEASAFKNTNKECNARKIYGVLRSSATTRFASKSKGTIISYPREKGDYTLKMYEANLSKLHVYTDRAATWEVRGMGIYSKETFKYKGHTIPMDFKDHFDNDPSEAEGMYLAEPPDSEHGFIEYPEKIDSCVDKTLRQSVLTEEYTSGEYVFNRILSIAPARFGVEYIITVDLGHRRDRACLSMFHKERDGAAYRLVQDLVVGWTPQPSKKLRVSIQNVEEFITALRPHYNITGVYFDQFQSVQMSERLNKAGIPAFTVYLDKSDYIAMRELLYLGRFRLQNFDLQLQELKRLKETTNRVDHPSDGTKDYADTICTAGHILISKTVGTGSEDFPEVEPLEENLGRVDPFI